MSLKEKAGVAIDQIEPRSSSTPPSPSESVTQESFDGQLLAQDVRPAAERRLVRMLDMRLLPTIILIYIMNYIDVSDFPVIVLHHWHFQHIVACCSVGR